METDSEHERPEGSRQNFLLIGATNSPENQMKKFGGVAFVIPVIVFHCQVQVTSKTNFYKNIRYKVISREWPPFQMGPREPTSR